MNHKHRGMMLEWIINKTIIMYEQEKIGIFHKKQVPITFNGIKKEGSKIKIKEGWIINKSTTDYYGIYKGRFIAFEAKSTNLKSMPLVNIKEHQQEYIKKVLFYGGIAFYIMFFKKYDEYFVITQDTINNIKNKSLSINIARERGYKLDLIFPGFLDFVTIIDKFIQKNTNRYF